MLPRKAIIAVIVASLLLFGYEGLSGKANEKGTNLLLGFSVVGAINAVRTLKELTQPF